MKMAYIILFIIFLIYPLAHDTVFLIYYTSVALQRVTLIFENRELEIKENYNSYTRTRRARARLSEKDFSGQEPASGAWSPLGARRRGRSAKRIRAHEGCLGIRRRRRTRKTATNLGEPSAGFDPGVSEWGNPASLIGCRRRTN